MPVPTARTAVVSLLLVASTVVWRRGDIFSGSLDAVVVGKAVLSVVALVLAFAGAQTRDARKLRLGTGSWWLLAVLLIASLLGAWEHGSLLAGGVIAARVLILAATVHFLLRSAPALVFLGSVVWACGLIAAVAVVTGLPSMSNGRIFGGIPPLNPNELAMLAGVVVLWAAWRTVLGEATWVNGLLVGAFVGVVWLTGSRTGLLMLGLAVLVMLLHLRRPRVGLVVSTLVLLAVGALVAGTTGAISRFLSRGGTGTSTLESRFIAWEAARDWADSAWQWAFGGGLSIKLIPVKGQWWDTQLLDSSWVSVLVQAGLVGLATVAVWTLWLLVGAAQAPREHRVLFLGLLTYLLGRSLLESGLFDATPAFLLFMALSLLSEGGSRSRLRDEAAALDGPEPVVSGAPPVGEPAGAPRPASA